MSNSPIENQTSSGQNEFSAQERLTRLDDALDAYERPLGIPSLAGEDEVTTEARRLLDIAPAQLQKMGCVELGVSSYVLGQYAHRLQQAINREQGRVTWTEESIKRIIAKTINNYRGVSFEERRLQAVGDNDAARKLDEIRVRSKLRIDRISFLANKAELLSKTLLAIHNKRRGDE